MVNELAGLSFGYLVLVVYWTVLVAELVGDKTMYIVSSLALRFSSPHRGCLVDSGICDQDVCGRSARQVHYSI